MLLTVFIDIYDFGGVAGLTECGQVPAQGGEEVLVSVAASAQSYIAPVGQSAIQIWERAAACVRGLVLLSFALLASLIYLLAAGAGLWCHWAGC